MILALAFLSGVFLGPAVRYEAARAAYYVPRVHVYVEPPPYAPPVYYQPRYRPAPPAYYYGR
ncbi:MAG: hypothetical protein ACYC6M_03000 [Terriglobales bacterium]